jgi:hypothetical protein
MLEHKLVHRHGDRTPLHQAGWQHRQVGLKLKTPWRDGTTLLVMSPSELMRRLAALVRRPRLHLIRFHGVLAPNARLRALVMPQWTHAEHAAEIAVAEREVEHAQAWPVRIGWARLLKCVLAAT